MEKTENTHARELLAVGYFLSRLGVSDPPPQLGASSWKEAYSMFYSSFSEGKSPEEFRNSLKNIRDHFDSHLDNERVGWKASDGQPQQLSALNQSILHECGRLTDNELWLRVRPFAVASFSARTERNVVKSAAQQGGRFFASEFSGKRAVQARKAGTAVVAHGLVVDCLKEYVESQFSAALVFNTQKIDLGVELGGNLKAIYEVKTSADTQSVYTAVGQLFMHSAGISGVHKWVVLPAEGRNSELEACFAQLGVKALWFFLNESGVFCFNDQPG